MAKLQMQRVYLCALKRDRRDILETLQRLEMVEVRDFGETEIMLGNAFEEDEEDILLREQVRRNVEDAEDSIDIIKNMSGGKVAEPFFLKGRKCLSDKEQKDYLRNKYDKDIALVRQIVSDNENIKDQKSEISHINAKLESLKPWMDLELPMSFEGTKSTKFIVGTLPESLTRIQIKDIVMANLDEDLSKDDELPIEVNVISTIDVLTYFTLICLRKDEEKIVESLRKAGFMPPIIDGDKPALEMERDLKEQLKLAQESIKKSESEINSKLDKIDDIRFLLDYETLRLDRFDVVPRLVNANQVFFLKGYAPLKYVNELREIISTKFAADIRIENVEEDDEDAPVLLSNNFLSSPVEGVIESYSLPSAKDPDPTLAVSIFYYFMFGLMLSDAGYGFVIFAASIAGLILFRDSLEDSWRKTLRMYTLAGAFTIFWGILFGSYFGDIVDVTAKTFFGKNLDAGQSLAAPVWFNPVVQPMRLLTFSLIVGIIHLFVGMFMKAIKLAKQKEYKAMFSEVILWYGILIGCIMLLVSTEMLGSIFSYDYTVIPPIVVSVGKILAIVSAIGIVLTNGSADNFGVKIAQGLYALYGISGYLSDVLSYSRLLALGLATGVIASVINMMAAMVAQSVGGVGGVIVFIIILIAGHTFNLLINALGAYVHTNRLQYVELFGKFYDGGGLKFSPLKMNTKYFKFKESRKNG